ncbi:MAG: hypothetical protein ACYTG0_34235 [Planctomycetota bacterium]|jgi:hypothetical protein
MVLLFFYWLSAVQLVVSGAAYVAALGGRDVFSAFPLWRAVLLMTVMVSAALYYAAKFGRDEEHAEQDRLLSAAPRWTKILTVILFACATVNFIVAMVLLEGAGPEQREDGSYVLKDHGRILRELTEEEYWRYRSYEARLFAGHWVLFSSGSLMLLAGARRRKQRIAAGEPAEPEATMPPQRAEEKPRQRPRVARDLPPSLWAAIASVVIGAALWFTLRARRYETGAAASLVSIVLGVLHVRRQSRKEKMKLYETGLGCVSVVPCAVLAIVMTWYLQWFTYLAFACGPGPAVTGAVRIVPSRDGPHMLTTGEVVDQRLLTGISMVVWPVGLLLGLPGLVYLADVVGRYLAVRPWRRNVNRCPDCRMPLRTEKARQCLRCGADWHAGPGGS